MRACWQATWLASDDIYVRSKASARGTILPHRFGVYFISFTPNHGFNVHATNVLVPSVPEQSRRVLDVLCHKMAEIGLF